MGHFHKYLWEKLWLHETEDLIRFVIYQTYKLNLEVDIFRSQDPSLLGKDLADAA